MDTVQQTTKTLTQKYLGAMLLIAALALAGFVILSALIETQRSNGATLNASGRRRYASQRIALFATLLTQNRSNDSRRAIHQDLKGAIALLEKNHLGLLNGSKELNLPGKNSSKVLTFYHDAPKNLHARIMTYIATAKRLADTDGTISTSHPDFLYVIENGPTNLIEDLEEVVNLYQKESDVLVATLHLTACVILLAMLALLVLESLSIFRPMVKKIGEHMEDTYRELEIQKARNIEAARLASLGEMAGGVAHEINSPLAAINMRASQVKRLIQKEPINKAQIGEFVADIEVVSEKIAKIIQGLRTFSRSADHDPFSSITAQSILTNTELLCGEILKKHGIKLSMSVADPGIEIECRSVQIVQALVHLIHNADDAISKLSDKWIDISLEQNHDIIKLSVTDSGSGIPEKIRAKLFQPFFTTKEIGKGTGLGLSIAQGIIENHGGRILVDTEAKNTRFVIEIPQRQAVKQAA